MDPDQTAPIGFRLHLSWCFKGLNAMNHFIKGNFYKRSIG